MNTEEETDDEETSQSSITNTKVARKRR